MNAHTNNKYIIIHINKKRYIERDRDREAETERQNSKDRHTQSVGRQFLYISFVTIDDKLLTCLLLAPSRLVLQ